MRRLDIRIMTLSFIVFILLFFSFVHGVFRLQLFKHTVNSELLEKLQVETLRLFSEYLDFHTESELTRKRIVEGNKERSRLIVMQMDGLIASVQDQEGPVRTAEEKARLLADLSVYNSSEQCFWIFDDQGSLVLGPPADLAELDPRYGKVLVDSVRTSSDGFVSLPGVNGKPDNPGYGKRIQALEWTLVSFQSWEVLTRRIEGFETLNKQRTDRLINQLGKAGSAGVVDKDLKLIEYTYAQLKDHHVDDIRLEGPLPASLFLFNKQDGIREYVIIDPVSGRGKYRQAYVHYDAKTGNSFFISQDKRSIFKGIDQRSSPMLGYLGGLSLLMLVVNTVVVIQGILLRKNPSDESS